MSSSENKFDDPVQAVASKQAEWKALSLQSKVRILQEIKDVLSSMTMEDHVIELLGKPEAARMGFDYASSAEGQYEAAQAAFAYVLIVHGTVSRLLDTYKYCCESSQRKQHPLLQHKPLQRKTCNGQQQTVVQTSPILTADKMGPFAKSQTEVWLKQGAVFAPFSLDAFLHDDSDNKNGGCMVVLAAGNHCFLSAVDCLHGLFHCNRVVYLKHHFVRNYHDPILRKILKPVIDRGYLDTELDTGSLQRAQEIVYHPAVARVHLTGGKAVHDAIVWGSGPQRDKPVLKALMTSELGCVTPWIVAPQQQAWTPQQLDHQVKHLFASLFNNAGANCNSPKVIILPKDWPQSKEFVKRLCDEMQSNPLPSAYYPGSKERWSAFRRAYPESGKEYGDCSEQAFKDRRLLKNTAVLLPWLVVDGIQVDLSTQAGRAAAASEYAFRNEPFCPVVTIAYYVDNNLQTAVTLSNDYLFGSLSCTVVAPETTAPDVEQAIADLKYGAIAVNCWSGLSYMAPGGTWGAFPGEKLENVESGIGQIHNHFFISNIDKTVLRTPVVDALHPVRKPKVAAARKELLAIGNYTLQPGLYNLTKLLAVIATGLGLPPPRLVAAVLAATVGWAVRYTFLATIMQQRSPSSPVLPNET